METLKKGMGWLPDRPDFRDLTVEHKIITPMLESVGVTEPSEAIPEKADLREWCSSVEDQGKIGSCTANAGVGMLEYYEHLENTLMHPGYFCIK